MKKTPCVQSNKKVEEATLESILNALREVEARLLALERKTPIINVYPQAPQYLPMPNTYPQPPRFPQGPWTGGTGTNPNITNAGPNVWPYPADNGTSYTL